jgi:thymidylate synthase (FAD)
VLQFYVETNRRVSAEFMRHRTFSYNEMSTRYTEVVPEGYVPDDSHMRIQKGRPGAYRFEAMDPALAHELQGELAAFNEIVAALSERLLARGYPKELAAYVLTLGNTTKFWVTGNLRNWFNFLTLRTAPNALMEIRDVADAIEEHVKEHFPECHAAWEESGRGQI